MRYTGHSCSYGESVLILQRKNKAFSFYLSLPDDDETKIKEKALDELSASELKKENGLDKLIEFLYARLKNGRIILWQCQLSVRLSVRPSVPQSAVRSSFPDFFMPPPLGARGIIFSGCPSVRPSVRPSVCHTFLTMFPSSYHHEIFRSYHHGPG